MLTTTPSSIKKPISVFAFNKELPVKVKPRKAPIAAKGMENIITIGKYNDSKTAANIMKIMTVAANRRK